MADKDEEPMQSVTTAGGDDRFLQDDSTMQSVGMTTDNGMVSVDNWGGNNPDSLMSVEEEGEGRASTQALAAARAHLEGVAQELAMIQNQFGHVPAPAPRVEIEEVAQAPAVPTEAEIRMQIKQGTIELEREKRHLEVDLDCANQRADRLATEKEELLAAQARLEGDLRQARKIIEEFHLQQQHRDMDLRKAGGPEAVALVVGSPMDRAESPERAAPAPLGQVADAAGLAPRPAITLSKQQAVAALRAAQAELRDERKRRDRTDRKMLKDKERMERLVAVAEAQQNEIRTLRMRCGQSEASAQEYGGRLNQAAQHSSALQMSLQGPRPISRGSNTSDSGGAGGSGPSMFRQQSAPTFLPKV